MKQLTSLHKHTHLIEHWLSKHRVGDKGVGEEAHCEHHGGPHDASQGVLQEVGAQVVHAGLKVGKLLVPGHHILGASDLGRVAEAASLHKDASQHAGQHAQHADHGIDAGGANDWLGAGGCMSWWL